MPDQRVRALDRGDLMEFSFDGRMIQAYPGESIAGALMAAGITTLRRTRQHDHPRGQFCGMGICFDCLVEVDGAPDIRACMALARSGLIVCSNRDQKKVDAVDDER